jgi:RNA polymerase sigma factor for flagellar operon FliA
MCDETIEDYDNEEKEEQYYNFELKKILDRVKLTDREKKIIKMYYYDELNLREIAEKLGYSHQGISLMLNKGIKKLQKVAKKQTI